MHSTNSKDDDIASNITEKFDCFINSVICPPESVYYAAEYLRLQGEIDSWKTKAKILDVNLKKKDLENSKIKATTFKDCEVKFQEKLRVEINKVHEYYETKLEMLRKKNEDMKIISDERSQRIRVLTGQLKGLNKKVNEMKTECLTLKSNLTENINQVKRLRSSESNLQELVIVLKAQLLLKERELNKCKNELSKRQSKKESILYTSIKRTTFTGKHQNLQRQRNETISEPTSNVLRPQTEATCETSDLQTHEDSRYQPILSPVTPTTTDENNMNRITQNDSPFQETILPVGILQETPARSELTEILQEHYEIFATLSHELALNTYMCVCGNNYHTLKSFQDHIGNTGN